MFGVSKFKKQNKHRYIKLIQSDSKDFYILKKNHNI